IDDFRDRVVARALGGANGIAHLVVAVEAAGCDTVRGKNARTFDLAALDAALEFENSGVVVTARLHGCEPCLEKLTHAVRSLLREIAVGRTVDQMTVHVDETSHHGHAGAIDLDASVGGPCGGTRPDGCDLAVLHDDRALLDHLSVADDDAGI